MSNNSFTGSIRDDFAGWTALDFADFAINNFTGSVPASIFDVPTLRLAYFSENSLAGMIPANYGNAPLLKDLYLNDNDLRGAIPGISSGQLTALTEFLLQGNGLSGMMPDSVCALFDQTLQDLWADCLGDTPVDCDCCTECF